MKKLFLLVSILLSVICTQAQDTIYYLSIPDKYYPRSDFWDICGDTLAGYHENGASGEFAISYYSKNKLKVYGIAGAYRPDRTRFDTVPLEKLEAAIQCMRLYSYDTVAGYPVQVGENLCFNMSRIIIN